MWGSVRGNNVIAGDSKLLLSNSFFSAFSFSELSHGLKTKSYVFNPNCPILHACSAFEILYLPIPISSICTKMSTNV